MSSSLRRIFGGHQGTQPSHRNNTYPRSDDFDSYDERAGDVDQRRMAFSFLQPSPTQGSINIESIERSRERSKALAVAASRYGSKSRLNVDSPSLNNSNSSSFDFEVDFIDENPSLNPSSRPYPMKSPPRKSIPPENVDSLNPFHPLNIKQRLDSQQFYSPRSELNNHVSKPPPTTHRPVLPRQSGMSTVPSNSSMRASNMAGTVPNSPSMSNAMSRRMMRRSDSSDMSDNDSFLSPSNTSTSQSRPPPRPQTLSSPTFTSQQTQRYPPKSVTNPSSAKPMNGSNNKDTAFFFDAFGLDEKEIDNQVASALEDIAGSNPEFMFGFDSNDGESVSSGFTNTSLSPSLNSARASPTSNPTRNNQKSPIFWDDETDASSFVMTAIKNNQQDSSHDLCPSTKQRINVSFHEQSLGPNSDGSLVKSSAKSSYLLSSKENMIGTARGDRYDSRPLPNTFSSNSPRNGVDLFSPKDHILDSIHIRDNKDQGLKTRSSDVRIFSQPDIENTEESISPGRRRAQEWGREQKIEKSAWPPNNFQHDSLANKSEDRARNWATETPSVIHQRRAVVGDSAASDVVFSDVNAVVEKMIKDGGQGFRPRTRSVKDVKAKIVAQDTKDQIIYPSEVSSNRLTYEATKYPTIELKGLSKAAELGKINRPPLENKTSQSSKDSDSLKHEKMYTRPTDRSHEAGSLDDPNHERSGAKEMAMNSKKIATHIPDNINGDLKQRDAPSLIRHPIPVNEKTVNVQTEEAPQSNSSITDARYSLRKVSSVDSESKYDELSPRISASVTSVNVPIAVNVLDSVTSRSVAPLLQSTVHVPNDTTAPRSRPTQNGTEHVDMKNLVTRKETNETPKFERNFVSPVEKLHSTEYAPEDTQSLRSPPIQNGSKLSSLNNLAARKETNKIPTFERKDDVSSREKSTGASKNLPECSDADEKRRSKPTNHSPSKLVTFQENIYHDNKTQPDPDFDDILLLTKQSIHRSIPYIGKPQIEEVHSIAPTAGPNRTSIKSDDDKYQNIAAMLSQRSLITTAKSERSEASSKKNEGVSDEKKGILSSLLSRRKAHEEPSKDSSANHILTSKTYGPVDNKAQAESNLPPLKDDPLYQKYFMMLKIGMPLDVVKHALLRDGLEPSVMDGDFNRPAVIKDEDSGIPLKDDTRYAKYFKMLKMGIPLGAVKNCMAKDGEDPDLLDGDHNAPAKSKTKADESSMPKEKDKFRRARVHWDSKGKVSSTSVWAIVKQDLDIDTIEIDDKEFESLFQAEVGSMRKADQGARGKESSSKKTNAVKVIDPKRANNGGIVLARLKMTYDELATAVDSIDDSKLSSEQVQGIVGYIPSKDERNALRSYITSYGKNSAEAFENLCECEKFMVAMMTVKHSKEKMRALQFKLQFNQCLQYLVNDINTIERACEELRSSVRFRKLLGIVLSLGNKLNTAGRRQKGKVGSFTIQSLLKLHQTKAFDNKTTFLQYVVLVVERNDGNLSGFKEDIPSVAKAEKIFWDQCMSDLDEVENQLQNVRKMALFETREKKKAPWVKSKNEEDDNLSDSSMTLEEEVAALRSTRIGVFALDAIKKVSTLMSKVETTKATFVKLLEYFGEEENKGLHPHSLFEIIVTFMKHYDTARKELITQGKLKIQTQRAHEKSTKKPNPIAEVRIKVNQPRATSASNVDQPVESRSLENDSGFNNLKSSPLTPSMSSLMSDLMNKVKIRQTEQSKDNQSDTNKKQQNKFDVEKEKDNYKKLPSSVDGEREPSSIVAAPIIKPKLQSPPPSLHLEENKTDVVEGSKGITSQLIHNDQVLTPSPTASKLQSPTYPAAFFIPENLSYETVSTSLHAFETNFVVSNPEERDEVPFVHQVHTVDSNLTVQKPPALNRSERDSVSNAQSTLRARRERLARRKLINR